MFSVSGFGLIYVFSSPFSGLDGSFSLGFAQYKLFFIICVSTSLGTSFTSYTYSTSALSPAFNFTSIFFISFSVKLLFFSSPFIFKFPDINVTFVSSPSQNLSTSFIVASFTFDNKSICLSYLSTEYT